jgi:hypothetical protein
MFAYTGICQVEADKFTTKVDASWNEAWTVRTRYASYRLNGNRLEVTSAWAPRELIRDILMLEAVNLRVLVRRHIQSAHG